MPEPKWNPGRLGLGPWFGGCISEILRSLRGFRLEGPRSTVFIEVLLALNSTRLRGYVSHSSLHHLKSRTQSKAIPHGRGDCHKIDMDAHGMSLWKSLIPGFHLITYRFWIIVFPSVFSFCDPTVSASKSGLDTKDGLPWCILSIIAVWALGPHTIKFNAAIAPPNASGIRSQSEVARDTGPYGGCVRAVRTSRSVCPRKYTGKTRFCRVVKADIGSAL